MARSTAPFLSIDASGTVAKTLTASKWKGRNYMRLRVIPRNPQSVDQQAVRSILGTIAKAVRIVLTSFTDSVNHVGSAFFQASLAIIPSGQSWVSYLQKTMNSTFDSLVTAYAALDSTHKGYWQDAAEADGLADYIDKSGDTQSAGFQLYVLGNYAVSYLSYTGFASGIDSANGTETTDFSDYCHVTNP